MSGGRVTFEVYGTAALASPQSGEPCGACRLLGPKDVTERACPRRFSVRRSPRLVDLDHGAAPREPIRNRAGPTREMVRAIRVHGALMQAPGASAVVMPGAERQMALRLGRVEGPTRRAGAIAAQGLEACIGTRASDPASPTGVGRRALNRDLRNEPPVDLPDVIGFAARPGALARTMARAAGLGKAGVAPPALLDADRKTLRPAATKGRCRDRGAFAAGGQGRRARASGGRA